MDFDMSPYGAYVWSAWAISAVALSGLVVRGAISARRWRRELERLQDEDR